MLPCLVAFLHHEFRDALIFLGLGLAMILFGFLERWFKPKSRVFYAKEGFVITALSWIVMSLLGAIPFVLTGAAPSYVDALFETASGLTTTGASVLPDPGALGYGIQFWRLFTHWIGGMGVLVFMLAVLPMTDGYSMHLMRAESPGPVVGKFVPKVKNTAKILYTIYIAITVCEILALKLTGLNWFESFTLAFSTVGTGGFGLVSTSIGGYAVATQTVIIVFMILCGVNFSVYYFLLNRKFKEAFHMEEVWLYFGIMAASAVAIAVGLFGRGIVASPFSAFHHSLFTVSSIMTTTGFATLDFNEWPEYCKTIIFILTLMGACAGSTGGGFKMSRVLILIKNSWNELSFVIHPKGMRRVYMDGHRVEGSTVKSVTAYLSVYVLIYMISLLLISVFDGKDFTTNMTAIAATINNVGPGFNVVGPFGGFGSFSDPSKLVLTMVMLAGRLELLPMLLLFNPRTWKKI